MISDKDKKKISKKYWNGKSQFTHPLFNEYNPFGNFHTFEGLEKQIQSKQNITDGTALLSIMTWDDENSIPVIKLLAFDISKKSIIENK